MKVKVYLTPKSVGVLGKTNTKLLPNLGAVEFFPLEPECPFCGKNLRNAECVCLEYQNALRKFITSCHLRDKGFVYAYKAIEHHVCFLKEENVHYHAISAPVNANTLFDMGTYVPCSRGRVLLISLGEINQAKNVLSFYVREKGSEKFYECKISGIKFQDNPYPSVKLAVVRPYYEDSGKKVNETERLIKKIPYAEFLEQLKQNNTEKKKPLE